MRDRYRPSLLDLFPEKRDHGTVASENIAETDGDKFCPDILQLPDRHRCLTAARMREELRYVRRFSGFDLRVKALYDHFTQPLAGTHNIGRIHSLVRADQHKSLRPVDHRGIRRFIGADGIVLDRLARAVLHQGNMLVGCRVIDDLRLIGLKQIKNLPAVPDRADQGHQVQLRIFLLQLQLDRVSVVFIDIENDQLLRFMRSDLPAKLRPDASSSAGHQYTLSVDHFKNVRQIGADRFPSKQVFHGNILHPADADLSVGQLGDPRQLLELTACLAA